MDGDIEIPRRGLSGFYQRMVQDALKVWRLREKGEKPVEEVGRDRWEVLRPDKPLRPAVVRRDGDELRCEVDPRIKSGAHKGEHYNQERPCGHILLVMLHTRMVELDDTSGRVWRKGLEPRPAALENQAWRLTAKRLPELLRDLLDEGLPALVGKQAATGGRPRSPLDALVYQSVMRVAFRMSNQVVQGAMSLPQHQALNPAGPVGAASLSRFMARPQTRDILEKLLALSTYPARPYETLVHPDGTGFSEHHFSPYFEERPKNRNPPKKDRQADTDDREDKPERRLHRWTYTEILWTYRYTMVASLHAASKSFGEAPWLIPLLERAGLVFDLKELGGDKAYNAYYLFDYAKRNGIEPQIKFKSNANPTQSHEKKKAYKRTYEASNLDPKGYAAKANRRNNAETGNHAIKAFLGSEVYNRGPREEQDFTSRANEVLCMALAYNLARLVFLEVHRGIQVSFAEGAQALAKAPWESLESLHRRFFKSGTPLPGVHGSPR